MIYNEAGYIEFGAAGTVPVYYFHVKDYLGSTRAVIDKNGNQVQGTDYYTGGMPIAPYGSSMGSEERLHTGKEFNAFSGLAWYDNGARDCDPITHRFLQQDQLAENYPHLSPYAYCANNPLRFIDLDGRDTTHVNPEGIVKEVIPGGEDIVIVDEPLPEVTVTGTPENSSTASKVMKTTLLTVTFLTVDDVTIAGIGDDILIPPIFVVGSLVAGGLLLYEQFKSPPKKEQNNFDPFAHDKKGGGKSKLDRHDRQYNQGGKNRPVNPNKRKGADKRKEKGKRVN